MKTALFGYFYISRNSTSPKDYLRMTYYDGFAVILMKRQATEKELLVNDLVYCGYGFSDDIRIKSKIFDYEVNMMKY